MPHASIETPRIKLTVYAVEGENGCRVVQRVPGAPVLRFRSTASVEEYVRQHRHLGKWAVISPTRYLGTDIADAHIKEA